jgi:hypothetical protein
VLAIFVGLILCLVAACSKQAQPKPVTLTFLDVEWDTPDRLPERAQTDLSISLRCGGNNWEKEPLDQIS